jgi:hypothetical protein
MTHRTHVAAISVTAVVLLAAGLPATAGAADVAQPANSGCVQAYPAQNVTRGMAGHGKTVSAGSTPEAFSANFLGVLVDGIAPGVDMVLADLSSPALTRANGVWEGMSGSPVYASDGRLVGAVAYGLSFGPSMIAGITPASQMYKLLPSSAQPASAGTAARQVALSRTALRAVVATGEATSAQADEGLSQLALPLALTGVTTSRFAQVDKRFHFGLTNVRPYSAGTLASSGAADVAARKIVAGGTLASALSYGDVTFAGVGTATAVCHSHVVAFGHPLLFNGPTTESVHGGDTVTIQPETIGAPFKLANLTAPVGRIDGDHLAGIEGRLGQLAGTARVTSHVEDYYRSRDGRTDIVTPEFAPDIAATHLFANIDRVTDRVGEGRSRISYTVRGQSADGQPFSVQRRDTFASQFDIADESAFALYDTVSSIVEQPYEDVRITGVDIDATLRRDYRRYTVGAVTVRQNGEWVTASQNRQIVARGGHALSFRVTLNPYRDRGPAQTVSYAVPVPSRASGAVGSLTVQGGSRNGFLGGQQLAGSAGAPTAVSPGNAASFRRVLDRLRNAPANNDVQATLRLRSTHLSQTGGPVNQVSVRQASQVATGFRSFSVRVAR